MRSKRALLAAFAFALLGADGATNAPSPSPAVSIRLTLFAVPAGNVANLPPYSIADAKQTLATYNRLVDDGAARLEGEPQTITRSGEIASFEFGDEVPIKKHDARGATSVTYRSYGDRVEITPSVVSDGSVLLSVDITNTRYVPSKSGIGTFETDSVSGFLQTRAGEVMIVTAPRSYLALPKSSTALVALIEADLGAQSNPRP